MDKVYITKETPFIIYGGGEVGNICASKLLKKGYKVIAGLDKKKEGENVICGSYTYKLGSEPISPLEKESSIVVICLADGMIHKPVADELYKRGYQNIVFLPMSHGMGDCEKRRLTSIYNCIMEAEEIKGGENWICPYSCYKNAELEATNGILMETEDSYVVYLRLEELFSESYDLWTGDKTKVFVKLEHKDKSIMLHPYLSIFEYFSLKNPSCDAYFTASRVEKSNEEKQKEIAKRENLYAVFKKEQERGMEFFIHAAPPIIRNPKGYFNLIGGHHRTLFLLSEGKTLFPVKMKKEDFNYWCNEKEFEELRHYINENSIVNTYAPISHPGFLNFPSRTENFGKTKLQAIIQFIERERLSAFSVLESEISEGYFSRFLLHAGAVYAQYVSDDAVKKELAKKIGCLKHISAPQFVCRSWSEVSEEEYDVVLALDFECKDNVSSKKRWNDITRKYLFVECSETSMLDEILKETDFKEFELIHEEFREGMIKKICVLKK